MFERLQKLHLCMSHSSTIKLFDYIGKDFDSEVLMWKKAIESEVMPSLPLTEVRKETHTTIISTGV